MIPIILCGCGEKNEDYKTQILIEINEMRTSGCMCGEDSMPPVRALAYDENLEAAARRYVQDMLDNGFFDHLGSDRSTPNSRASDAGFTGPYIGENIARGYISAQGVMQGWKESEEHCKTIMSYYFSFVGVAYEDYYWVTVFGSD